MNSEFAYVDDAVVIDLSDINSVTVDVQSKVCFTDIRESFYKANVTPSVSIWLKYSSGFSWSKIRIVLFDMGINLQPLDKLASK